MARWDERVERAVRADEMMFRDEDGKPEVSPLLAHKKAVVGEEDEEESREDRLAAILDHETYCLPYFEEEDGRDPGDTHADPSDYDEDDLLAMLDEVGMYDPNPCPLHVSVAYPHAPMGVWSRDVDRAFDRLRDLTREHTGREPDDLATGDLAQEFHATAAELAQVWTDHPHARWKWEEWVAEGRVAIVVTN